MLGAIIGDMVGSIYEFHNHKGKDFPLFSDRCFPTDDSIMTIAVAKAILENKGEVEGLSAQATKWMRKIGRQYPGCGYGGRFYNWMFCDHPRPYGSFGNGAAMRVSACGFAAKSLEDAKALSYAVTSVTHDHPEGIKGAEATACAIFLARTDHTRQEIRDYITENYYDLDFTLDEIRPDYRFNETCQETVPQAIVAFLESNSFEDAIRNAISIGGDSDTLAAITGAIAEAYYGIRDELRDETIKRFSFAYKMFYTSAYIKKDPDLLSVVKAFEKQYGIPAVSKAAHHEIEDDDSDWLIPLDDGSEESDED